ncbi:hypothetical protein HanIR_Chr08g0347761 [Helianthus annuus]|nr:hypothetical protein HanIR_Chr08g0347761 [Helianthus annuus]
MSIYKLLCFGNFYINQKQSRPNKSSQPFLYSEIANCSEQIMNSAFPCYEFHFDTHANQSRTVTTFTRPRHVINTTCWLNLTPSHLDPLSFSLVCRIHHLPESLSYDSKLRRRKCTPPE